MKRKLFQMQEVVIPALEQVIYRTELKHGFVSQVVS